MEYIYKTNFSYRISPKSFPSFRPHREMSMLELIHKPDDPPGFLESRNYHKGVKELVIHSGATDTAPDEIQFSSTGGGICMLFNYGDPVGIRTPEKSTRLLTRQQNILNLTEGTFSLCSEETHNRLIHLLILPSAVFEHIMRHFQTEKLKLNSKPFRMLFRQNLHISEEVSHNLHAFHGEGILPESAGVYTYGRLLIFLSLQFSQYAALTLPKIKEPKVRDTLSTKMYHLEKIVRSDFTGRSTLSDLARLVGTNECYLKRQFKSMFGMSVRAYQRKIRMEKANHLLLNTDMSIEDISTRLGYKHTTHFTATYKKNYGVTPGEARRGLTA